MSNVKKVNNKEVEDILDEEEEKLTPREQLEKDFESINQGYTNQLEAGNQFEKSTLSLDRKTYDELSEDDIANLAKNSLSSYYNDGIGEIKKENENAVSALSKKASDLQSLALNSKASVEKTVDNAKDNAKNEAIKRGLARSSIIMKQLEDYDDKKISQIANIENELNNSLAEINYEIDTLSNRLEESLKSFDLSYAVELQEKINTLKQEQRDMVNEVLEYNNMQTQEEADFNAKQNELYAKYADTAFDNTLDLSEYISKNGDTQIKKAVYEQKYAVAEDYFNGLSKAQALEELLNEDFEFYKEQLGAYFYKLYSQIKSRKN